jgi:FtsP/CotA-like multicopper oxidase with cupredoxin domain
MMNQRRLSRRIFLGGGIGLAGLSSNLLALPVGPQNAHASSAIADITDSTRVSTAPSSPTILNGLPFMEPVDPKLNGFDPAKILTIADLGKVSKLPSGQTLREFTLTAINKTILVAPGKKFDALTYNGQVPGPTLRAIQGDHIRITFINQSDTAHGMHFAGIHSSAVDVLTQSIPPSKSMIYEFDAEPFGLYLYRGLVLPLITHVFKGLYGTLIVDPPQPRPQATELFMTLNSFILDSGGPSGGDSNSTKQHLDDNSGPPENNDIYTINTVAYHFVKNPIAIPVNKLVRVYLINVTEFDLLNSFHLHGNLFNTYRSGTSLKPDGSNSTIMLGPGQHTILEFSFQSAGEYMFHAYQGEYAELGCMGIFNVQ